MQPLRLAVVLGTPLLAIVAVLVACGDDTAVPIPGGGASSSTSGSPNNKGTSGGSSDDDDTKGDDDDDDDDTTKEAGADANCKFAPSLHHTDAGFFCDFYDGGPLSGDMAGGKKNCPTGATCCNPAKGSATTFPPSYCADGVGVQACADKAADNGSTWTPGTAWECGTASNCGGGKKCCAVSFDDAIQMDSGLINYNDLTGTGAPPAACKAKKLFAVGGTRCQDECDTHISFETCSTNDACSNGKKCFPVASGNDRDLGICPR